MGTDTGELRGVGTGVFRGPALALANFKARLCYEVCSRALVLVCVSVKLRVCSRARVLVGKKRRERHAQREQWEVCCRPLSAMGKFWHENGETSREMYQDFHWDATPPEKKFPPWHRPHRRASFAYASSPALDHVRPPIYFPELSVMQGFLFLNSETA